MCVASPACCIMAALPSSDSGSEYDPSKDQESDLSDSDFDNSDQEDLFEEAPEPIELPESEGGPPWKLIADFHTDK